MNIGAALNVNARNFEAELNRVEGRGRSKCILYATGYIRLRC